MRHLRHRCMVDSSLIRPRHPGGLGYVRSINRNMSKKLLLQIMSGIASLGRTVVIELNTIMIAAIIDARP